MFHGVDISKFFDRVIRGNSEGLSLGRFAVLFSASSHDSKNKKKSRSSNQKYARRGPETR